MPARLISVLAVLAGLLLVVAAVSIPFWMAAPGIGDIQAAQILWDNRMANYVYAFAVLLSCALVAPVIVALSLRLYGLRPGYALLAGPTFLLGLVLEAAGAIGSLARWAGAVSGALAGDELWLAIYRSLTALYLAVNFSGVALIYIAGVVYAIALWRLHRLSSCMLVASAILLIVGLFLPGFYGTVVLAGSIAGYGLAYAILGYASVRLGLARAPQPTVAVPPARERRPSTRRRRRR